MPVFVWDESCSVGVKSCDEQHQKLFSLINALHEAMRVGKGRAVMKPLLEDLGKYTQSHFTAEEALLEKTKYPGLAAQRAQHKQFVQRVRQFQDDLAAERNSTVAVVNFLKDWLVNHIKQTDREYTAHLNANGIK